MSEKSDGDERRPLFSGYGTILVIFLVAAVVGGAGAAVYDHTNDVETKGLIPLSAPDGMQVNTYSNTYFNQTLTEPYPTSGTVEVGTEYGNISFYSAGNANATIYPTEITSTFTIVRNIDADPNSITITPEGKDAVVVAQEITRFEWRANQQLDDGTVDFRYGASGPGEVTVQGYAADTRVAAFDTSTGQILDETTTDGSGTATFSSLDSGSHDVKVQTFNPSAPTFANASPTGGTSSAPTEVSVDVSDADFPDGDSVSVTVDVDGTQVHSETISSNQTVTASVPQSGQTGGTHSWSVQASDSYGESSSDSYSYIVPKNLTVRNEENNEIIDGQQVNLTVYTRGDNPQILNFTTNDGTVDLGSGFPSGEPFVVVAESNGYLDRRIFVESLYDTQNIYLLNESVQHTEVIFQFEDYSGNYPPDQTVLKAQRGINGSWETVLGDYFGANDQFSSQIKYNTRHRLVLLNAETGEQRILGSYTPLTSGTETLTISPSGELQLPETHPTFEFTPTVRTLPDNNSVDLSASISAGDIALQDWGVSIYHINGNTNNTLYSQTGTDASGGTKSTSVDLSGRSGSVKVVTSYTLEGGASGTRVATYNINAGPTQSMSLLDGLLGMVGLVPNSNVDMVKGLTAMILTIVGTTAIGSKFRMSTESMGLVTLSLVGTFAILGWVDYSLLFIVIVLFASLTFLRRRY